MLRDRLRPYIPQIVKRELTNRQVASELNVSEYHLCRVLKQMKVEKDPAPDRKAQQELLAARKSYRTLAANTMSIKDAAAAANCSTRTIYRLRKKKP